MQDIDEVTQKSKRRHGPMPRPGDEIRTVRVSVYFTPDEAAEIRRRAAGINPAAYLRSTVLGRRPIQIPKINREAYQELARSAGNLNQIAHSLNILWQEGGLPSLADIEDIKAELSEFRIKLLGVKAQLDEEELEEETA